GCVYVDIDHHYYIPPDSGVAEIDILAGYQRLCGLKALQYVRYRHTDNDLVRSARQQGFLREARQQVPTSKLVNPFSDERRKLTPFPIYYPTKIPPDSTYSDDSRSFKIDGPGSDLFYGYKLVISHFSSYYEYYGASGTDWRDPPILANPSETKTIDGRDYL